jgi:hypothetical protein
LLYEQAHRQTWDNITPKGLQETIINSIDISPHEKGTVYIATTRYKFNDKSPGLYKSTNYGKSWKEITGNIPYGAYTRVVREDQKRKGGDEEAKKKKKAFKEVLTNLNYPIQKT